MWINSVKLTLFSKGIPLLFIEVKSGFSLRNSDPVGHLFRKSSSLIGSTDNLHATSTREGLESEASDGSVGRMIALATLLLVEVPTGKLLTVVGGPETIPVSAKGGL